MGHFSSYFYYKNKFLRFFVFLIFLSFFYDIFKFLGTFIFASLYLDKNGQNKKNLNINLAFFSLLFKSMR